MTVRSSPLPKTLISLAQNILCTLGADGDVRFTTKNNGFHLTAWIFAGERPRAHRQALCVRESENGPLPDLGAVGVLRCAL